ncbi:MAG: transporter substrate-binding domain-containing protein [Clostridia bacterium]|nr:transporter substrate-binding domain-containing protein [Clostridia bacterium]
MIKRYFKGLAILLVSATIIMSIIMSIYLLVANNDKYTWVPPNETSYNKTLKVVGDVDFAPISFIDENGNAAGYDVELLYELGKKLRMNIELELLPWKDAVEKLEQAEADLMISVTQSAGGVNSNERGLNYSVPLFVESYVIFTKIGTNIHTVDLNEKNIALLKSDFINDYLIDYYHLSREENITKAETIDECFRLVSDGECDCAIAPLTVGNAILNETGRNDVYATNAVVYSSMHYFATPMNVTGNELHTMINGALHEIEKEGISRKIYDYWMVDYLSKEDAVSFLSDYSFIMATALVLIVFFYTIVVFIYEQRQSSKASKTSKMLQFERQMYRDSLIFNCDYALTVNVSQNELHTIHKIGSLDEYGFDEKLPYDEIVERFLQKATPFTVTGVENFHSTDKYASAYNRGKRIVEFEYYVPHKDSYIKEIVLLSEQADTGDLFAFVVGRDMTSQRREELKNNHAISSLAEVAARVGAGDLEVDIDDSIDGAVGVLAKSFKKTVEQLRIYINSIKELASVDPMTGMANRTSYVGTIADIDVKLATNSKFSFGVVMIDLNDLKKINDIYGHEAGDDYILESANLMKAAFESERTILFRTGGDEFVAIIFDVNINELNALCEGFNGIIAKHNAENTERPYSISLAYGYALYNSGKDKCYMDTYNRADAEMYKHKNAIKNGAV